MDDDAAAFERAFALLVDDDAAARERFEALYLRAAAHEDAAAAWLAAAGALISYCVAYADFRGLPAWCERFAAGCAAAPPPETTLDRLRIAAALLSWPSLDHGVDYRSPRAAAAAEELRAALVEPSLAIGADERLLLFKLLVDHYSQQHDVRAIARVAAFANEHLVRGGVGAAWRGRWWLLMLLNHEFWGDAAAAADALARAAEIAAMPGQEELRFELACIEMNAALKADDRVQAERLFDELDRLRPAVRAGRLPQGLRAQALLLARNGEHAAALERVDLLLDICADTAVPLRERGAYFVLRAVLLGALHRHGEAAAQLEALRPQQSGSEGEVLSVIERLAQAVRQLDEGGDARALVASAITDAARLKWNRFLLPLPALAGRIAEIALDAGVETEFVRATVRARRLVPADPTREDWPWRLQLYAFGELRIVRDGEPLRMTGAKAPRKPLALLGVLAAHGGEPLDVDALVDLLWPSLEANAPRASLEMALSRLRKLLAVPDALELHDGMLGLNRSLVWCDVAAFESVAARLERGEGDAAALAERAIALYRAGALGGEELAGALKTQNERHALLFKRIVLGHGARLEAHGDWRAAADHYERAIARDMACEPLHRALIRAQLGLGEAAEALRSFRRCRDVLPSLLGAAPGPETLALVRDLDVR